MRTDCAEEAENGSVDARNGHLSTNANCYGKNLFSHRAGEIRHMLVMGWGPRSQSYEGASAVASPT